MPMKISRSLTVILAASFLCASALFGQVPESIYKEGYEAIKKLFSQAVVAGDQAICKELLEKNAYYINEADSAGLTQLHYAAMSGQTEMCRLFLKHGAKADIARKGEAANYYTPLEAAIANNHTATALVLIDAVTPESLTPVRGRNTSPLFLAIQNENVEIIKALIAKKADVNTPGKVGEVVQTPFACAISIGNKDIAKILLDAGADIKFEQGDVRNADTLFTAVLCRDYEMCSFLVESKIDVKAKRSDGATVLHTLLGQRTLFSSYDDKDPFGKEGGLPFAVTGPYKTVKNLSECGLVEAKGRSNYGDKRPKPEFKANRLCKLFIDADADVNVRDKNDCSVLETLFLAQVQKIREYEDFQTLLELLIAAKVDVNSADESGWTPLYYLLFYCFLDRQEYESGLKEPEIKAIADKKIALFQKLIEAGAKVKVADKQGNTLLHYVVQSPGGNISKGGFDVGLNYDSRGNHRLFGRQLIELLLEHGASLSDENKASETPLDWATRGVRPTPRPPLRQSLDNSVQSLPDLSAPAPVIVPRQGGAGGSGASALGF
jgi:ankyrin repeat protein